MDLGLLRQEEIGLTEKDHASKRVLLSGTERIVHPQVSCGQVWHDSSKCRGLMARREGFREPEKNMLLWSKATLKDIF